MKAKIVRIKETDSKLHRGIFYYIFFKDAESKSYRTYINSKCKNYQRWDKILDKVYTSDKEIWLDGLILKSNKLINADSDFKEIAIEKQLTLFPV